MESQTQGQEPTRSWESTRDYLLQAPHVYPRARDAGGLRCPSQHPSQPFTEPTVVARPHIKRVGQTDGLLPDSKKKTDIKTVSPEGHGSETGTQGKQQNVTRDRDREVGDRDRGVAPQGRMAVETVWAIGGIWHSL